MKPEKMSEEELAQARKVADYLNEEGTSTIHRLLAHIAALTAERDHLREVDLHNMTGRAEHAERALEEARSERDARFTLEEVEQALRVSDVRDLAARTVLSVLKDAALRK